MSDAHDAFIGRTRDHSGLGEANERHKGRARGKSRVSDADDAFTGRARDHSGLSDANVRYNKPAQRTSIV
ncbi:hypothetical protein [Alkalibacterium subtropicum]|uniref:hypothetical protein n=1 Tax=Alkalibacterium subtropicum TaxID=753702 RepID=UPI0011604333|nr:hypothetical protein [Alkalibacterium subtropicum]